MRLRNIDGTEFVDISLQAGDYAVGKSVKDLALKLPEECILISIRRNNRVLIPHGDTRFQPGDQLTAFIRTRDTKKLQGCLRGNAEWLATGQASPTEHAHQQGQQPPPRLFDESR
jgi:Trk K+ transport system NAD-binding subunit